MNGGPSGFNNAPVTRAVVVSTVLFTILFGIQARSRNLNWSYQDIFKKLQIWKLIVSVFGFSSTPELVFGVYLLYYFRVFERQIGSNKYTVFILFSIIVSILLEVLALGLLKDTSLKILTSGPYGLIFSSFVPFFFDIPISTRFRVLSLNFSDKTFIYLAGLQLFLSSWKRSMLPICGILAGSLYRMNIFRIRRIKLPEFVASFFSRLSWPSVGSSSPPTTSRNGLGSAPSYAGQPVQLFGHLRSYLVSYGFREIIEPQHWCHRNHLRRRLQHWFQWGSIGTQQGKHLYTPGMTLMLPPTSSSSRRHIDHIVKMVTGIELKSKLTFFFS